VTYNGSVAFADAATAPIDFPVAPALAIPKALEKAGITKDQVARWEINEAFAAVVLANVKLLGIDPKKVNVLGGAVALGHAVGSSACRILVTLIHQLKTGEIGVVGVCNGGKFSIYDVYYGTLKSDIALQGGAASAMVIERL